MNDKPKDARFFLLVATQTLLVCIYLLVLFFWFEDNTIGANHETWNGSACTVVVRLEPKPKDSLADRVKKLLRKIGL